MNMLSKVYYMILITTPTLTGLNKKVIILSFVYVIKIQENFNSVILKKNNLIQFEYF
jgi:hypothetical protein